MPAKLHTILLIGAETCAENAIFEFDSTLKLNFTLFVLVVDFFATSKLVCREEGSKRIKIGLRRLLQPDFENKIIGNRFSRIPCVSIAANLSTNFTNTPKYSP
jgi:hypothetical protein